MIKRLVICGLLLSVSALAGAQSHQSLREQIFGETDAIKKQADELDAAVLAPEAYAAGHELYVSASETVERGRDLQRARRDLTEAQGYFAGAIDTAKLARVTFVTALAAREAARRAEAERYAERDWDRAEEALVAAAETLEGGSLNRAQRAAGDAESRYRETEARALTGKARGR